MTVAGTTTLGQSRPGSNGHEEGYFILPTSPELEQHEMQFSGIPKTIQE